MCIFIKICICDESVIIEFVTNEAAPFQLLMLQSYVSF